MVSERNRPKSQSTHGAAGALTWENLDTQVQDMFAAVNLELSVRLCVCVCVYASVCPARTSVSAHPVASQPASVERISPASHGQGFHRPLWDVQVRACQ